MCIVKGQHEQNHGHETGRYEGVHAQGGLPFGMFGNFNFNGRGGEPIDEALEECDSGSEVFKFVIVLEEALFGWGERVSE